MKRKSLSKRTRFEIFKRDSFRCVYCGATPLQRDLRVDHVVAIANGGTDDPPNLVTTCDPCNAGKSDVPLERQKFGPVEMTEAMEDRAELVRSYLENIKKHDEAVVEATEAVREIWEQHIGGMSKDMFGRMKRLIREWPIEKLHEAIEITGRRIGNPDAEYDSRVALSQAKYFSGVLRRWREEAEASPKPPAPVGSDPAADIDPLASDHGLLLEAIRQIEGQSEFALVRSPSFFEMSQRYRTGQFRAWLSARLARLYADLGIGSRDAASAAAAVYEEISTQGSSHHFFEECFSDGGGI